MKSGATDRARRRPFLAGMLHYDDGISGDGLRGERRSLRPRAVMLRLAAMSACLFIAIFVLTKPGGWALGWGGKSANVSYVEEWNNHVPWVDYGEPVSQAKAAHLQAEYAWSTAATTRRRARERLAQPWAEAGTSRMRALRAELEHYSATMHDAPMRCREEMRPRLPQGWGVTAQALGQTANVAQHGTWRVSGILTIIDETGLRQRYHYQCDFVGSELTDIIIADPRTLANPRSLYARR